MGGEGWIRYCVVLVSVVVLMSIVEYGEGVQYHKKRNETIEQDRYIYYETKQGITNQKLTFMKALLISHWANRILIVPPMDTQHQYPFSHYYNISTLSSAGFRVIDEESLPDHLRYKQNYTKIPDFYFKKQNSRELPPITKRSIHHIFFPSSHRSVSLLDPVINIGLPFFLKFSSLDPESVNEKIILRKNLVLSNYLLHATSSFIRSNFKSSPFLCYHSRWLENTCRSRAAKWNLPHHCCPVNLSLILTTIQNATNHFLGSKFNHDPNPNLNHSILTFVTGDGQLSTQEAKIKEHFNARTWDEMSVELESGKQTLLPENDDFAVAFVEQSICGESDVFVGCSVSTFAVEIQQQRKRKWGEERAIETGMSLCSEFGFEDSLKMNLFIE